MDEPFCRHSNSHKEELEHVLGSSDEPTAADFTDEGILELPIDSMITVGRGAR